MNEEEKALVYGMKENLTEAENEVMRLDHKYAVPRNIDMNVD